VLGFTDNVITNHANAWDLVVFDIGSDGDGFSVAVDLARLEANIRAVLSGPNAYVGYNGNGLAITATFVDLSEMGVPVGDTITTLAFAAGHLELAAVGAADLPFPEPPLNDDAIPEPTTLIVWSGLGAVGLIAAWRRRRQGA